MKKLKLDADTFAHELAEGIIGDMYPVPGRMLRCCERIVHEYLRRRCATEAARRAVRPLRGRRRHRGDVLHLRLADAERAAASRRHHRPGGADVHALHRDRAHRPLRVQGGEHRRGQGAAEGRQPHLAVRRRGDRQAGGQADQGVLPREPQQPAVLRDARQLDAAAGEAGEDEASPT